MDRGTPGLPVHHQLLEFTQTHVHRVGDAIQPSHCPSAISDGQTAISVIPFSSCPQSLTASESFPMSQLFAWGGQSIGVSPSSSVLPINTQDSSPLGLVGPPCSPRNSQESSSTPQFKSINSSALSFLHNLTLYPYMTTGKTIALTKQTSVDKVMSLLLNILSSLVINFLPRSKCLFIS